MTGDRQAPRLPDSRQITLVGGSGAGKTRFMRELMRLCGDRAYWLSAIGCDQPKRTVSDMPGSIDVQFRRSPASRHCLHPENVSELDKLSMMLFADEFEYLLEKKFDMLAGGDVKFEPTRLDRLKRLWEMVFPGNSIVRHDGRLMFATSAGDDLIPFSRLSRGETSVLYYISAVLYALPHSVIFIDSPSLMIHPSIVGTLWNALEELRSDCRFVYDTVDVDFIGSRTENVCVWVKNYDAELHAWDYEVIPPSRLSEDMFVSLMGTRKPVLFIEGDAEHSIDAKLYSLVFTDYTVRPLGSCNKVIETTRSFSDLKYMHHLDSHGIVDRDRRSDDEVSYLRRKNIFVPNVAEVENIFLLPEVISVMARRRGRQPHGVVDKVRRNVMKMFAARFDEQALQHVRHRVKREVECRIDGRFSCITAMETHLSLLVESLKPRERYMALRTEFSAMIENDDYTGVLKVFNHKPVLSDCGVGNLLGYGSKDEYIAGVLAALKSPGHDSETLRAAVKFCFGLRPDETYCEPLPQPVRRPRRRKPACEEEIGRNNGCDSRRASGKKKKNRQRRSGRSR